MSFPQMAFGGLRNRRLAIASSNLIIPSISLIASGGAVKEAVSDLVVSQPSFAGAVSTIKVGNSDLVVSQPSFAGAVSTIKVGNSELVIPAVSLANSTPVPTDPYLSMVELFLKGDGANNGTVFTDSSDRNRTVSRVGGIVTSTTESKYGGSSLFFPSTGENYLTTPVDSGLTFGSTDLTFEAWVRFTSIATTTTIMGNARASGGGDFGLFLCASAGEFRLRSWATNNGAFFTTTIALNTWYHIAATKIGSTARIWVNGVAGTSGSVITTNTSHTSFLLGFTFENSGFANNFRGYMDSPRVTKGVARYTANFNPETDTYLN